MADDGHFVFTLDGTDYLGAYDGTISPSEFAEAQRCSQCGLNFRKRDMMYFQGQWYGKPCGDFRDIRGIIRKQDASNDRATRSNTSRRNF